MIYIKRNQKVQIQKKYYSQIKINIVKTKYNKLLNINIVLYFYNLLIYYLFYSKLILKDNLYLLSEFIDIAQIVKNR